MQVSMKVYILGEYLSIYFYGSHISSLKSLDQMNSFFKTGTENKRVSWRKLQTLFTIDPVIAVISIHT